MQEAQRYRCITIEPLKIGGSDPPEQIRKEEVVLWNPESRVLTRVNGNVIPLVSPNSFLAAIDTGWIVPEDSPETTHRPQPAGIKVREAAPRGPERNEINLGMTDEDHIDVGDLNEVRKNANTGDVPGTHIARKAGTMNKMPVIQDEGRVVGKMRNSPIAEPVEVGKGKDKDIVQRLSKTSGSDKVVDGVHFPAGGATTSSGAPTAGGAEAGVVVGKATRSPEEPSVPTNRPPAEVAGAEASEIPADIVEGLRTFSDFGTNLEGEGFYSEKQLRHMVGVLIRKYDAAVSQVVALQEAQEAEEAAPEFEWDPSVHWKTRHSRVVSEFADDPVALRAILDIDPSAGVKKAARELLEGLDGR